MKDFQLTRGNIHQLFDELCSELEKHPLVVVTTQSGNIGKWEMARMFRGWMRPTAEFAQRIGVTMPLVIKPDGSTFGVRPFNEQDSHELWTRRWLGVDENGDRLSWSKKGRDGMRPATKGERFNACRQHEEWATDRGISLFRPRDSEYCKLGREQDQ